MKIEHYRISRLSFYRQWKEQRISKEEYLLRRDEMSKQEAAYQDRLRSIEKHIQKLTAKQTRSNIDDSLQFYDSIQELTKELADKLIDRIDVYEKNRVEIHWKFQNEFHIE